MKFARTVFVLGAGVSAEVGFPSGGDLFERIAAPDLSGSPSYAVSRLQEVGFAHPRLQEFQLAVRRSGLYSIDAFLEQRPEFAGVGRAAIAAALIPAESEEALLIPPRGLNSYRWIYNKLRVIVSTPEEFVSFPVTFVTFNYDRSLEHFLFTVLNEWVNDESRAMELVQQIEIIHPHGSLGLHPAFASNPATRARTRPYETRLDFSIVERAMDGIRIIHEIGGESPEFGRARHAIEEAEQVIHLGFGYHSQNVKRLFADAPVSKLRITGTARGLSRPRQAEVAEAYKFHIVFHDLASLEFLERCVSFLTPG